MQVIQHQRIKDENLKPVSIDELRAYCRIVTTQEDTVLTTLLNSAISFFEKNARVALLPTEYTASYRLPVGRYDPDHIKDGVLPIPRPPLMEVKEIYFRELGTVLPVTFEPETVFDNKFCVPDLTEIVNLEQTRLHINYIAGYETLPEDVKEALFLTVSMNYERGADTNLVTPKEIVNLINSYKEMLIL